MSVLKSIWFWVVGALFIFHSCANPVSPTGGAKDTEPPKIAEATPENETVNFTGNTVVLKFDEFIKIENVFKQVLVSPPMPNNPKFVVKGKSLKVEFQDSLQANTTYTINFGSAIKDITEGNSLENFTYVFSTGPFLDSLVLEGSVFNAETNKPEEGVLVMLYSNLSDSVVVNQRPDYFAKTSKDGKFKIQNLKNGTFKIAALKDGNFNLKYDLTTELIGFLNQPLTLNDSLNSCKIGVFVNEPSKLKLAGFKPDKPGKVFLAYNSPIFKIDITSTPISINQFYLNKRKDTVTVWLADVYARQTTLFCAANEKVNDTLKLNFRMTLPDSSRKNHLKQVGQKLITTIAVTKDLPFTIKFNRPVKEVALGKIKAYKDSLLHKKPITYSLHATDPTKVILSSEWQKGSDYRLLALPKAFTDIYGFHNDSLELQLKQLKGSDLGSLKLSFTGGGQEQMYLLNVLDAKGGMVMEDAFLGNESKPFTFKGLKPGKYKLVVIEEQNKNGRWDTGNYFEHRQPERKIFYKQDIELRANWEFEAELSLQ